mmetsp:Transcript_45733/g.107888  ORF Transcript_45733/g.107888 Transcript_45733/m.107888 type:complete len:137 (-) Transcript_45733:54-464(-)|eukprot:CAMPEP_0117047232 /NCGR_PEP_ID=MMETSP0472-20121206/32650_1 /TAXON_ID=693140 ORGANISM="Tiarina fusus, Strain LIS" /NCGR_SAMPLE_ID=MMETSP0472 /ASSEMBLY_ACC=CAM_ASM_000603 /LENGTH=136 /DNA_ID=CAMNT_0004759871 /DNA_START=17 /DNA_END=427 /DNA_ORIENTATION=+
MVKFLKPGKVVLVTNGRYAGKKAVIVRAYDDGVDNRRYGHAIVAGVAKTPLRVRKAMSKKTVTKRTRVKPFLKSVNYNHIMPTRYNVDLDLKALNITPETVGNPSKRGDARREIKKVFQEKFTAGKNKWFFSKLRF